ncbi:hypothetical protein V8B97DRAFT_1987322 [Scleroderma yunnanense]
MLMTEYRFRRFMSHNQFWLATMSSCVVLGMEPTCHLATDRLIAIYTNVTPSYTKRYFALLLLYVEAQYLWTLKPCSEVEGPVALKDNSYWLYPGVRVASTMALHAIRTCYAPPRYSGHWQRLPWHSIYDGAINNACECSLGSITSERSPNSCETYGSLRRSPEPA